MEANFKQVHYKYLTLSNENEVISNLNLTFTHIKFHAYLHKI